MPNFDISGKIAVVTGGAGVLCSAICRELAEAGARVAVLGRRQAPAEALAAELCTATADAQKSIAVQCDVLDKSSLEAAYQVVVATYGRVDILINGAGGNNPQATTSPEQTFFDLPPDALRWVVDLNLLGTILPSQVFGKAMAEQDSGVIINFSSMAAFRPLTRVLTYSAAKAGVNNFTRWLAVHMAQTYSPNIRVNAIAPGFFIGKQNRSLLLNPDNSLTPRGEQILAHTPMARFGVPEDLLGALIWLVSPAASFVSGIIIPVDGGFSAFAGV